MSDEKEETFDLEEELAKSLAEEIKKEIEKNGSYTWEEFCAIEEKKQQ